MKVVEVKKIDKKKSKIIFDDGTVFALYNGEIFKDRITEGTVLDSEEYNAIKIILRKRARERCLYLLKDSDKTVKQIKDKLKELIIAGILIGIKFFIGELKRIG